MTSVKYLITYQVLIVKISTYDIILTKYIWYLVSAYNMANTSELYILSASH